MSLKDLLYIVIIIVVITFFMNDCSRDALIEREKITISDTSWNHVEVNDTSWNTIKINDTIYKKPQKSSAKKPMDNRNDSLRSYVGVYNMDYGSIFWKADVSGHLEEISFSGGLKVPQINNTKIGTVTKTVEITKTPRWNLYGGAQFVVAPEFYEIAPTLDLRIGKVQYGYGYGLVNKSHLFRLGVTIK